ncbi:hypothetical protein FB45DRAFT_860327 [Roridomyces roridus]|uniref:NAD(P)-binding protein n=1 Tax=Roridomyces roridus TaxID=1738132 RepID=A0AAD7CEV9_9AGAR|nr:hypothetical protein FB45DRAFT_860327 [Roridomyces roridus]
MSSYVITGAARGIGPCVLAFVAQLSTEPNNTIFALVRSKSAASHLESLPGKNITIIEADITDSKAVEAATQQVSALTGGKLDYLINNAAMLRVGGPGLTDFSRSSSPEDLEKELMDHFRVNTVGTVHCTNAFLPLLRQGSAKKVVVLSTGGADLDLVLKANMSKSAAYAISKAAVNMVVAKYAAEFKQEGFVFLTLSPGYVDTSATATEKIDEEAIKALTKKATKVLSNFTALTPEESVKMQLEVIYKWKVEDSGAFVSHHGNKEWM